jgi:quercetin dioxygenase-like cupin family protein
MTDAAALARRLADEGLDAGTWSNGPGERYGTHEHAYDKVIVAASGSIVFGVPGGPIRLATGDRLELPSETSHDATVGPDGVACLEAHLPAGTIPTARHRPAGTW